MHKETNNDNEKWAQPLMIVCCVLSKALLQSIDPLPSGDFFSRFSGHSIPLLFLVDFKNENVQLWGNIQNDTKWKS